MIESTVGSALGGAAGGLAAASAARGLPGRVCVALSPTHVHLLGIKATGYAVEPIAEIDRVRMTVETCGRAMNEVVVIVDGESGADYELEAPRINPYSTGDIVDLLSGARRTVDDA